MLWAEGLIKTYPGRPVLDGLDLELGADETLAIVGPSGCGKTTLLYILCGLKRPDAGRVTLGGVEVGKPSPEIAIILQDYGLLPWKTILDNVALGLKIAGAARSEREAAAREQLARMGLAGRERDYPHMLSGGEKQRVAIARALAARPRLLLMDEPFSSLDAITREKLQETLLAAWREVRAPYVIVTHSVEEAVLLGRRILLVGGCPARIGESFDNPGFGARGYREQDAFFDLVRRVRAAMGRLFP